MQIRAAIIFCSHHFSCVHVLDVLVDLQDAIAEAEAAEVYAVELDYARIVHAFCRCNYAMASDADAVTLQH